MVVTAAIKSVRVGNPPKKRSNKKTATPVVAEVAKAAAAAATETKNEELFQAVTFRSFDCFRLRRRRHRRWCFRCYRPWRSGAQEKASHFLSFSLSLSLSLSIKHLQLQQPFVREGKREREGGRAEGERETDIQVFHLDGWGEVRESTNKRAEEKRTSQNIVNQKKLPRLSLEGIDESFGTNAIESP